MLGTVAPMHDAPPPPQPSAAYLTHVARETVARLDGTQTVGSPFRGAGPALLDDLEAAARIRFDDPSIVPGETALVAPAAELVRHFCSI